MRNYSSNCTEIRTLEERLACLKGKYDELTNQLEEQRGNSSNSEEILDYHHLIEERRLVEKYMQKLASHLSDEEKSRGETIENGKVGPGNEVLFENETHKLKVRVVERVYSNNEKQISIDSPIGKAALGKRVGESIIVKTPRGEIYYKILSIE